LHVGQTRWDCFGAPQLSQVETRGAETPCCARRLSRRDFDVLRFGTAMSGRAVYLFASKIPQERNPALGSPPAAGHTPEGVGFAAAMLVARRWQLAPSGAQPPTTIRG